MAVIINGDTGIDKITDGSIVAADIGAGEVGSTQIASGAVGSTQLASTLDLTGKTVTLPSGTGGKVLQVVQATTTTNFSTSSASFVSTGFSGSITPSSASNKILVYVLGGQSWTASGGGVNDYTIYRGGSNLGATAGMFRHYAQGTSSQSGLALAVLDAPSATTSTTYTLYMASTNGGTGNFESAALTCTMILMEIVG